MATPIKLADGLGGAIGSDYVQSRNQLYFVEFNGKVSVLDLVRQLDAVVFTGPGTTMPANSSLDLTNGTSAQGGDIRWDHVSPDGKLVMRPQGNNELAYLGPTADYDAIGYAELQNLSYSQAVLRGEGANNQLTNGAVFAVFNRAPQLGGNFDYAKVQVLQNAGGSIKVRWTTLRLKPRYRVIGTGYNQPEDIKVTAGGRYAYVTERAGNLLRVDLTNANRAAAQTVASGMTAPHQIALDEAHGQAYVPEFVSGGGRIWRVDLAGGTKTAVYTGLEGCVGLLISKDLAFAYVSEQAAGGGRVARINLATAQRTTLRTGLVAPFFMEWADDAQSRIYLVERDPANRVTMLDITTTPATPTQLLTGVPFRPSSVVQVKPGKFVVCCDSEIDLYDLAPLLSLAGPLFMGIGLVPVDHIINTGDNATDGYADTTDNPAYLLQVKDAPFGGSLAIMVNHNAAFLAGANYYKLFVSQVTPTSGAATEPRQGFSDYLWNAATSSFVPTVTSPDAAGFYPVRAPWQVWYNPTLGYVLDTGAMANGLWVIDLKLYNAAHVEIPVGTIHSRRVKIDNQWPVAHIDAILHSGVEVPVCSIVNSGADDFTFRITANDPQGHLLSWSLVALWGDNKSKDVSSDNYNNHVSPSRQWAGLSPGIVPPPGPAPWHSEVAGDTSSKRCAHTFFLSVWDRVINGYGYLHNQTYHKSITIWL